MGCPGKNPARFRISNRLPSAAAPAILGVAAAIALSAQITPDSAAASTTTLGAASTTPSLGIPSIQLLQAIRSAAVQASVTAGKSAANLPTKYTVKEGDSLTAIARKVYHDPGAWPVLYWANRGKIRWANNIRSGQVLSVPVKPERIPAAPSQLGPAPAPAPVQQTSTGQSTSTGTTSTGTASTGTGASTGSTYSGGSSFQQCVIARESGGNSQIMNSTGHYGLYQFSASTWAAYGGNPADFGHASVAEQNQVFANAIAAGGQSNWSAYDGC